MNELPSGKLTLYITGDGRALIIDDQELTHVVFHWGHGDPTSWSAAIVERTCKALNVTTAIAEAWENEELQPDAIDNAISWWHELLGADDGFLP